MSITKLLQFKGFGNPAGPYWFIGVEERGDEDGVEARTTFNEIEDLARAHGEKLLNHPMTTLIPTWATMSKIVLRLEGYEDWLSTERIRWYQAECLGRTGGETFLGDLLPLPAINMRQWHYPRLYETREQYLHEVLPQRKEMWARLFRRYNPRWVFCYGKGMWAEFEQVFGAEFEPAIDGRVRVAFVGNSTVVLTPFFFYYLMTSELVDRMATTIERRS